MTSSPRPAWRRAAMIVAGALLVAPIAVGRPAVGQTAAERTLPPGGQVAAPHDGSSTSAAQVSSPRDGAVPAPPAQVVSPDESDPAATQLATGDRSLSTGERLTAPGESRNVATARLAGRDRCDPRTGTQAATATCRQVIETRAASFARERPDLSPEQRLLAERYPQTDRGGLTAEVRRVGRNDVDPASSSAQTLAAIIEAQRATEQAAADAVTKQQAIDAANAALVSTIVPPQQ